jgi:hypothetical protein
MPAASGHQRKHLRGARQRDLAKEIIMAWTTMHFATGMACAGAGTTIACVIARRGWRWIAPAMTLGGLWACVPDMPRFFRVDFPSLPFSATLGSMDLERFLHGWGNLFFFHRALDAQPRELALHGLIGILLLYNLTIAGLLWFPRRAQQ